MAVVKTKTKRAAAAAAIQQVREGSKRDLSPKWDGAETWSGEQFTAHYHAAMQYYNLNSSGKELKPRVIDWMGRNDYDKKTITEFKNTKDSRCGITF